jgi:hypothetical protein
MMHSPSVRHFVLASTALLLAGMPATPALANLSLGFERVTGNSKTDIAPLLGVTVSNPDAMHVSFVFRNMATLFPGSFIAQVYFDEPAGPHLMSNPRIETSPGVVFKSGGSPSNLSGGKTLTPVFGADYVFSAKSPSSRNGLGPYSGPDYDQLTITFSGIGTDVLGALIDNGLRIGLHVQGLPGGTSDSFVSHYVPPPTTEHSLPPAVPSPAASGLCLLGLALVTGVSRSLARR